MGWCDFSPVSPLPKPRVVGWGPEGAEVPPRPESTTLPGLPWEPTPASARTFLDLLAPFGTRNVVVRRRAEPVPGAERTVTTEHLHDELSRADVVVVAAALTTQTRALVGAPELSVMKPGAALVNIARGGLVDTDALVAALTSGRLGGAALDVTDPEPLPDGHPLWDLPTALVTPHTADTREMIEPLLRARIEENLRRFVAGQTLVGVVDPVAGY